MIHVLCQHGRDPCIHTGRTQEGVDAFVQTEILDETALQRVLTETH